MSPSMSRLSVGCVDCKNVMFPVLGISITTSPVCPLIDVTTGPSPLDSSAIPKMSISEVFIDFVNSIVFC
jgi:hypothetical protein